MGRSPHEADSPISPAKHERSTMMRTMQSMTGGGVGVWAAALALGMLTDTMALSHAASSRDDPYPTMAPVSQYLTARTEEIDLPRSAAPPSIADPPHLLALAAHA